MINLILFDDNRNHLKPLTFTRPVAALRIGVLTIKEKWEHMMAANVSYATVDYLSTKYPITLTSDNFFVNGGVLPTEDLCNSIQTLDSNTILEKDGVVVAARLDEAYTELFLQKKDLTALPKSTAVDCLHVKYPWDLFKLNGAAIEADFTLLTQNRVSQPLSKTNQVIGDPTKVFLEEGAWVECAILNTNNGPIYIGKNATVMEGSIIRGGFALCEGATTKMAAKIYGPTTIGPYSKVGGEVNNSVIIGYTNKGHDGFLGNSVLGEWCNLGADTNNSNLKNNYGEVRLWNYDSNRFASTGLQFCGLIMGDHSKTGINTMLNTGTVIGVSCNVFGGDFPRKYVPSFSWGSSKGFTEYKLNKVKEVAERVMLRRNKVFDELEEGILKEIFSQTQVYRKY